MALEGKVEDAYDIATEGHDLASSAHARLDRAAEVVNVLGRRLGAVERKLTPATLVTEEQATEISLAVRALAHLRAEKDPSRDHYGAIFGELYRH